MYFTRETARDERNVRKEITGVADSCGSGRDVPVILAGNTGRGMPESICIIISA